MDPAHEERAIAEVQVRLEARFPDLDPTVVEAAVRLAQAEITGPVRDFVPVLVERAARTRLAAIRAEEDDDDAPTSQAGTPAHDPVARAD
jgi:hypothetical protein